MTNLSIIHFETEFVEKCFKKKEDFVAENFAKEKEQFEKHRSPFWQLANFKNWEITEDSSIIERAVLQFLNDIFPKSERKHLLRQSPCSQFSNEHSLITALRQLSK
jgi:hypothetical protein